MTQSGNGDGDILQRMLRLATEADAGGADWKELALSPKPEKDLVKRLEAQTLKVGDEVDVTYTEALAISVEPAPK